MKLLLRLSLLSPVFALAYATTLTLDVSNAATVHYDTDTDTPLSTAVIGNRPITTRLLRLIHSRRPKRRFNTCYRCCLQSLERLQRFGKAGQHTGVATRG